MADEQKPHETPKGMTAAEVEAKVKELLATKAGGDAEKLCRMLLKTATELRGQLAEAQAKQLPKDHVAVPKAKADLLAEYEDIGPPAELKEAREALPAAREEAATLKHESALAGVAKATGYSLDVLKRLAPIGVAFQPTKVKVKDKEVESFNVKDKDPQGKERTRTLQQWEDDPEVRPLLPALKPTGKATETREGIPVSGSSGLPGSGDRRPQPKPSEDVDQTRRLAMQAAGSI